MSTANRSTSGNTFFINDPSVLYFCAFFSAGVVRPERARGGAPLSRSGRRNSVCKMCIRDRGELLDRKGMRFPVRCSGPAGARTVYNPIPIYMGDRLKELPVELPLLYFTIETAARVREVLALVRELSLIHI